MHRILRDSYECKSGPSIDVNCVDSLGRSAINLAIENENLEMVELLIVMGVEPKDALLHAINAEFVEAVELLLEYEELIYVEGDKYVRIVHQHLHNYTYNCILTFKMIDPFYIRDNYYL